MATIERTITAAETTVNIGGTVAAKAQTFNGAISGPTLRLNVNSTVIVRLINEPEPASYGVEEGGEEYARVDQSSHLRAH